MLKILPLLILCASCTPVAAPTAAPQRPTPATEAQGFSSFILQAIRRMPHGGGYSGTPATVNYLAGNVVEWQPKQQRLSIHPHKARPSFCSGACYLVLLQALQQWEQQSGCRLPAPAWQCFAIHTDQADGHGIWGRANANGPGLAKLVADTQTGFNFTDYRQALPGDFLKIFWTPDIGAAERGHLVVFLGTEHIDGHPHIRYWSANKPGGYGIKTTPVAAVHHPIFTRITAPQNFANTTKLAPVDRDLSAMLSRHFTYAQILKMCKITR